MQFAYTIIYVPDVAASLSFLKKAFGCRRRFWMIQACMANSIPVQRSWHLQCMKWGLSIIPVVMSKPIRLRNRLVLKSPLSPMMAQAHAHAAERCQRTFSAFTETVGTDGFLPTLP
jgi:hypothetical protein